MVVSALLRADFEQVVSEFLVNEWRKAQVPQESAGDAGAPVEKLTITEVEPAVEKQEDQPYLPLAWL